MAVEVALLLSVLAVGIAAFSLGKAVSISEHRLRYESVIRKGDENFEKFLETDAAIHARDAEMYYDFALEAAEGKEQKAEAKQKIHDLGMAKADSYLKDARGSKEVEGMWENYESAFKVLHGIDENKKAHAVIYEIGAESMRRIGALEDFMKEHGEREDAKKLIKDYANMAAEAFELSGLDFKAEQVRTKYDVKGEIDVHDVRQPIPGYPAGLVGGIKIMPPEKNDREPLKQDAEKARKEKELEKKLEDIMAPSVEKYLKKKEKE